MALEELLAKASKKCEIFSNPLRSFIVTFIALRGEVTWTELKSALEKWAGRVNPNTLSFHLGELTNAGFIEKVDIKGMPRYKVVKAKLPEIKRLVGDDVFKAMKETVNDAK